MHIVYVKQTSITLDISLHINLKVSRYKIHTYFIKCHQRNTKQKRKIVWMKRLFLPSNSILFDTWWYRNWKGYPSLISNLVLNGEVTNRTIIILSCLPTDGNITRENLKHANCWFTGLVRTI